MNVALVCIAKKEDNYIDEWIEYHFKLGFSKIIIYQNDWRYNGKYINDESVELIEYDGIYKQMSAYNKFIKNNYSKYDWAGFIDVDEFIVLKKHSCISNFLEDYNDYDAVGFNWSMFGSNGLEFNGEYSVIKRFTKCRKQLIHEIKCFVNFNRTKDSLEFTWHPHNVESGLNRTIAVDKSHFINGPWNDDNEGCRDIAYINHYYIKTPAEFRQKMDRGWPMPMGNDPGYDTELFNKFNAPEFSEYEDLTAYNFMYNNRGASMLLQQRQENDPLNLLVSDYLTGKQGLIGIEIGSYRGESTEIFLKSNAFSRFYCIDPWIQGYDPDDPSADESIKLAEEDFDRRFKNNFTVVKIRQTSDTSFNLFDNESIDFIYIDACHTYEAAMRDLIHYVPKIKHGGIIAGHDYQSAFPGVTQAVDEFFKKLPLSQYQESSWVYIKE